MIDRFHLHEKKKMRNMDILTIAMLTLLSLTKAQDSFHPDNVELHKIQRSLLQEYDEVSDGGEEETNAIPETTTKAPIVYKGIVDHGVPKEGPRLFYDGSKFIMRLGGPVSTYIFKLNNHQLMWHTDLGSLIENFDCGSYFTMWKFRNFSATLI